jgi:hypothetical protein
MDTHMTGHMCFLGKYMMHTLGKYLWSRVIVSVYEVCIAMQKSQTNTYCETVCDFVHMAKSLHILKMQEYLF